MTCSTLFTFAKSWHQSPSLYEQLGFASAGDAIILIQDAVLALQSPITLASFVAKCELKKVALFCLAEDCALRGIEVVDDGVQLVSYAGYVDLVTKYEKQIAW